MVPAPNSPTPLAGWGHNRLGTTAGTGEQDISSLRRGGGVPSRLRLDPPGMSPSDASPTMSFKRGLYAATQAGILNWPASYWALNNFIRLA